MHVLISGGSSGIGLALAETLVQQGHEVSLMARSSGRLAVAVERLNTIRANSAISLTGDVANPGDCRQAVDLTTARFGRLDALVNTAGGWVGEPLDQADEQAIASLVQTDVLGAVQITRAALPQLRASGGRIIHVNGLQGFHHARRPVMYTMVESAVTGLCRSLRWEAAQYGVHVGLIHLGAVDTEQRFPPEQKLAVASVVEALLFMLARPANVNVDEMVLTPLGQQW